MNDLDIQRILQSKDCQIENHKKTISDLRNEIIDLNKKLAIAYLKYQILEEEKQPKEAVSDNQIQLKL